MTVIFSNKVQLSQFIFLCTKVAFICFVCLFVGSFVHSQCYRDLFSRAGDLGQWLALLPFTLEFGSRSLQFKRNKMFLPHPLIKRGIVGSLRDREVECSAPDLQGSNFESCVWRAVSSHSSLSSLMAKFSQVV